MRNLTRTITRLAVTVAAMSVAGALLTVAPATATTAATTAAPTETARRTPCPHTMPDVAEAACHRDRYRAGRMGHSAGRIVPPRIRRMLVREYRQNHRDTSARSAGTAVRHMLNGIDCAGAARWPSFCADQRDNGPEPSDIPWRRVGGVAILCGTGAFMAVSKAPALGVPPAPLAVAGEAVGGCLFGTFVTLWSNG